MSPSTIKLSVLGLSVLFTPLSSEATPGLSHSRFLNKYLLIMTEGTFQSWFFLICVCVCVCVFSSQNHFCLHETLVKTYGRKNCMVSVKALFSLPPSHLISSGAWQRHKWSVHVVLNIKHVKPRKSLHFLAFLWLWFMAVLVRPGVRRECCICN